MRDMHISVECSVLVFISQNIHPKVTSTFMELAVEQVVHCIRIDPVIFVIGKKIFFFPNKFCQSSGKF